MREAGSLRRSADAADRRAANDAIVRLTRLGSPELERIADSGDGVDEVQAAEHHFDQQSSIAVDDALATLLRSEERLLSSQGSNGPRRGSPIHARTSTMMRPLSGVSRPRSPADSERATPDTPLRGTSPDLDSGRGEGGRTSPGMDLLTAGSSRSYVGGGGGGGSVATHTGSAATLPSKARALLDRHSFYSSGVRNYDNLPPRNFTIHGEPREKPVRVRRTLESREASGYVDLHPERRQDGSSRGARILCVKQIIQKAVAKQGSYSRAQLERSFRRADKDSSGALEFSELCASLREDFKIAGLTTADILRVFRTMDADQSGSVSCREFVEAIDSTPPPVLRNPVGYRRVPSSLELKKREAFTLWPTSFSLGTFRSRLESRNVEIVVQNVGLVELRLRAHVLGLVAASPRDGGLGQAARIGACWYRWLTDNGSLVCSLVISGW